MPTYPNLDGTMELDFHIGGPLGPEWSANGQALEALDSTGAALTIVRGADPAVGAPGEFDLVPKAYLGEGRIFGWARFDALGILTDASVDPAGGAPVFAANAVVTAEALPVAHMRYRVTHLTIPIVDAVVGATANDFRAIASQTRISPTVFDVRMIDTFNLAAASGFVCWLLMKNP